MLNFFKILSCNRSGWILLFISALMLEMTALYFQYMMDLQPCVMCIYERTALFGIMFSALIAMIYPKSTILRIMGLIIALGSAIKGLQISLLHWDLQNNPSSLKQCTVLPEFPATFPLDQWFPAIFKPTGLCGEVQWQFLGISMVEWIVVIFAFYVLLLALILLSQLKRTKPQRRLFR